MLLAEDLGGTAGNTLVIEHGGGVKSIFYNLRALQVDAGDTVGIGEQIATTNAVTIGEVRIGEVPVDPLPIWRGRRPPNRQSFSFVTAPPANFAGGAVTSACGPA